MWPSEVAHALVRNLVFPPLNICTNCGADPLVCGRRPRRPASVYMMLISLFRLRDEGVPRRPGGLPQCAQHGQSLSR
jgi:hypothetical protein